MKATIDSAGRLVVPKKIREMAGLRKGMTLEISYRQGVIEIVPEPRKVRLVKKGDFVVALPEEKSEPLRQSVVQEAIEDIRTGRNRESS